MYNKTDDFHPIGAILGLLLTGTLLGDNNPEPQIHNLPTYFVTGTHLLVESDALALPLTSIDEEELQLWADLSPISSLRDQPFAYGNANTENDSNGGNGSAGANIRGLGNLSTLTLINGRRAGGNSAVRSQHGGFADLNLIPTAAIRKIDVVTDGTSVAYGSDAVAGTVNVLLHDSFTGNRIDTSYSNTTDGDAAEKSFSFLSGIDLNEKTNLVLLGSWYQRNAIDAHDRGISQDADHRAQGGQDQGSPTFPGRIRTTVGGELIRVDLSDPSLGYRAWDPTDPAEPVGLYNFSEFAPAIPEQERQSVMAHLTHDLGNGLELLGEFLYSETTFSNGLAPAPWTAANSAFEHKNLYDAIIGPPGSPSPHFPASVPQDELSQVGYRSFELGNLNVTQKKDALRGLFGLRGQMGEWHWEAAGLLIETELEAHWSGIADARRLEGSIIDGSFNPFAGAFGTGSTVQVDTSVVSYDNAAALRAAESTADINYEESYSSFDIKTGGPAFELPAGSVQVLIGAEYRQEEIETRVDELIQTGNNLGGPILVSPFAAEREVTSFFAEATVPLLSASNNDAAQILDLHLAIRYEDYTDEGNATNTYDAFVYKCGLTYSPKQWIQFRASYGTSFRAPTLTESFGEPVVASYIYDDPSGPTPDSARIPTLVSGNPDLDPEKSTNLNLGFTMQSEPDRGWRLAIDYYRIQTEDAVVNSGQDVVNRGAAFRDGSGNLFLVFAEWFNAAEVLTDGIDYKLSYQQPTAAGHWQATLGVNQVLTYQVKAFDGGPTVSYLGRIVDPRASNENIAGPGSIPRYKGYARLIWVHHNLTLGGTVNYIHSLEDNPAFTSDGSSRTVVAWTSLDLLARYNWSDSACDLLRDTTVTVGIENVTNEAPPFAAGAFADGYDSSLYSLEGRRISISLSRRF